MGRLLLNIPPLVGGPRLEGCPCSLEKKEEKCNKVKQVRTRVLNHEVCMIIITGEKETSICVWYGH